MELKVLAATLYTLDQWQDGIHYMELKVPYGPPSSLPPLDESITWS